MIKVLVTDDSKLVSAKIASILEEDSQIEVVGFARDGEEAIKLNQKLKPDLITMDIHMPNMDGFEATKQIMGTSPIPILMISASVFKGGMDKVFKALSYGALEVIDKGSFEGTEKAELAQKEFVEKVKMLSKVRVVTHPLSKIETRMKQREENQIFETTTSKEIIAIAASTGGTQALRQILGELPQKFPCPIVVVQHMSKGFIEGFADWLNQEVALNVKVAEEGEELFAGFVYIAPSDLHMKVNDSRKVLLEDGPLVHFQKPSGSVLLESVAKVYGSKSVGVILTGMGSDGSVGLKAVYDAKGHTIAQDEVSSVVFGMPKAAIDLGAVRKTLPLFGIAAEIIDAMEM